MATAYQEMKNELSTMVENHGLRTVLVALGEMCGDKERHFHYGTPAAKAWRKAELTLDKYANNLPSLFV